LPADDVECLSLCEVVDRLHPDDAFVQAWKSFDPVRHGQAIGKRHDGTVLSAPFDGFVVFPNPSAEVGHEWFYLAAASERLVRNKR
jgi:uncharacterized protein